MAPNKNYEQGRRIEYKTRDYLVERGYEVVRAAGSKGKFDIVAYNDSHIRFIQVKYNCNVSAKEKEAIEDTPIPPNGVLEIWAWKTRVKGPEVTIVKAYGVSFNEVLGEG